MKKTIPLLFVFVTGVAMIIQFFIPHWPFNVLAETLTDWAFIVFAGAMLLGVASLLTVNMHKIYRQREGWPYSIVAIVGLLFMCIVGIGWGTDEGTPFFWAYDYLYYPMSSTMFSLLAFFVASAAFRAFKARTAEATLLLVAAFFVMLGRVPLGGKIGSWVPDLAGWIMNIPNTAGNRAIMIGIALGVVSTSLRIILGYERPYMAGGGD